MCGIDKMEGYINGERQKNWVKTSGKTIEDWRVDQKEN